MKESGEKYVSPDSIEFAGEQSRSDKISPFGHFFPISGQRVGKEGGGVRPSQLAPVCRLIQMDVGARPPVPHRPSG